LKPIEVLNSQPNLTETQQDFFLCLDVTQPFHLSQHKLSGPAQWQSKGFFPANQILLDVLFSLRISQISDIIQITIHVKKK